MKWFNKPSKQNIDSAEQFERCVMCNDLTNVRKNTAISARPYYIQGSGQLCRICYCNAYCDPKKVVSAAEIQFLVDITRKNGDKLANFLG